MSATGHPFTNFNFAVELRVEGEGALVCNAAFAECDGIEMTLEAKTIKEGGSPMAYRVAGAMGYGTLTLRRGMSDDFDLWDWFARVQEDPAVRADGEVVVLAQDGVSERARFLLRRCLPTRLKAPALNAREGAVAIEELQLVYDALTLQRPGGSGD